MSDPRNSATRRDELRLGQLIDGRYRVGEEIGRGAMGAVYRAEHERLDRRVAIKVLHRELADDGEACERFEREARAASRVGSEHIVDVLDAGALPDGRRYLVMEHLRGETLKDWFARLAPFDPEVLVPIIAELAEGLAAAHDEGIVHRDVKPDNVFLVRRKGAEPLVKIVDFGVSKFRDVGANALQSRTGVVLGTPHYMAPEQARGERDVDRRADIYSVGVVLYEGLCGRRPFSAANVNQLLFRIVLEDVPRVDEKVPGLSRELADIVARATARTAEARYQSARQLADDLRGWLRGDVSAEASGPRPIAQPTAILDEETRDGDHAAPRVVPEPPARGRRLWLVGGAALLIAAGAWVLGGRLTAPAPNRAVPSAVVAAREPAPVSSPLPSAPSQPSATATPSPPATTSVVVPRPRAAPVSPPRREAPEPKTPRPIREDL